MKIALITDLHFGVKKNNVFFLENMLKFYNNEFIPYLREHKIKEIFVLGDVFESREHINVRTMNEVYALFNNIGKEFNVTMILGNHDTYYKNNTEVNSLKVLFDKIDNTKVLEEITRINLGNRDIVLVPWQTDDSFLQSNTKADICFGHFDIRDFNFNKLSISKEGFPSSFFYENFKITISGHYHNRSIKTGGNSEICYMGAPYHLTRSDIGTDRGFAILDLDTLKYEFINSVNTPKFVRIDYPCAYPVDMIKNNLIDIYVDIDETYDERELNDYKRDIDEYEPYQVEVFPNYCIDAEEEKKINQIKSLDEMIFDWVERHKFNNENLHNKTIEYISSVLKKTKSYESI